MVRSTASYRDSRGRSLEDYPRPSVAVDTAVLTVADGQLCVLLTHTNDASKGLTSGRWRLPGTFLHPGESLSDAALRALRDKAGVAGLAPRQLHVFDDPRRDDRGWVLSVAHVDGVRADRIPLIARTELRPVADAVGLEFDHDAIVAVAVEAFRDDYRRRPDPARLLADARTEAGEPEGSFTIRDLRLLHEVVLDTRMNADTFRRTMLPVLRATGEWRAGARGKPAELYVRA